jgi:hypothetical protein
MLGSSKPLLQPLSFPLLVFWPFPVLQREPHFVSCSFPVPLPFGSETKNGKRPEAISPAHIAGRFSYTSPRSWRVSPALTRFLYSRRSCVRWPRRWSGRPRGTDGRLRCLMLLTKDSTNLPNPTNQAAQAVAVLPLEGPGKLLADQGQARFVALGRTVGS